MGLKLYDTMRREKVDFAPIDSANVRMYVCGPTVYDFAHIGNARPVLVFDVLFRLLRQIYGEAHVTYARNVTDVDDKINLRAYERGITIRELTEGTLTQFHADIDALGVLRPSVEPRATDHIEEMRQIVDRLIARGFAYVSQDHVLFDVPAMTTYGQLSKRDLSEMEAGARVEVESYKRDPTDFVLWKPSTEAHEPKWDSPAGIATPGRPGWHIECSAMAWKHLGEVFDIHGGGIDLVFPHHENEIAQSCCAFGEKVMANVWMHNGFLNAEGEKMSKSLGNFVTIRELLADWPGEVIRLTMLKTHYRQPIDWTEKSMEESRKTLDSWYRVAGDIAPGEVDAAFLDLMGDDLNTPGAIARLHELAHAAGEGGAAAARFKASVGVLGLLSQTASERLAEETSALGISDAEISERIAARLAARKAKSFAESDRIRDELAAKGVQLKDGKDPATGEAITTWEVAR